MTHLKIEQNTSYTENVSLAIIEALYNIAKSGQLDNESNLLGTVRGYCYEDAKLYLESHYPNFHINVIDNDPYIRFEDSNVLGYLSAAGIGDGTGITTANAAQASLGTVLKGKTDIVSFNGLRYFTSWLTNPTNDAFYGCTNLTSVTLPNTITKFPKNMFYKCNNLSLDISLFNCVLSIGLSAFDKCYEVYGTINMPELQTIGSNAFCLTKLSGNLVLNQSLTCTKSNSGSLGEGAFRETNITSILFPSGVTHINSWLCYNCPISSRIMYLPYITSAGCALFGGNTNISQFYLPNFTDLNTKMYFRNTSDNRGLFGTYPSSVCSASLAYFKDLEDLYPGIVSGTTVTTLVLNNSNITLLDGDATRDGALLNPKHKVFACSAFSTWPNQGLIPLWNRCGLGANNKIFVPDNSVNDYKTNVFNDTSNLIAGFDSSWIHGINEIDSTTGDYLLPRVNTRAEWDLIPDTDPNKNFTLILEYCGSNHGINPPLTTT